MFFAVSRARYEMNLIAHVFSFEPKSPTNIWDEFLESKDYKNVMRYYGEACGPKILSANGKKKKPRALPSKKCWYNALTKCVELWQIIGQSERHDRMLSNDFGNSLVVLDKECSDLIKEPMWVTLSFLLKGLYYIENDIPLNRLQDEEISHFLLHAAIGALPLCNGGGTYQFSTDVFDRVMELHSDQVNDVCPSLNRLPIHIAAANKGRFFQETYDLYDDGRRFVKPQNLPAYMLETVIDVDPKAASVADANGYYPVQLASMNGHSCASGILKLVQAAPAVVGSSWVLLAMSTERSNTTSKKRFWKLHQTMHKQEDVYYKCSEGQKESLDTVYQLLRTDPVASLNALLY